MVSFTDRMIGLAALLFLSWNLSLTAANTSHEILIEGDKGTKGYISQWGGGIRILREFICNETNVTKTTGEIRVIFEEIRELNDDGKMGRNKDDTNRTMDSFAAQNFTCLNDTSTVMPHSEGVAADCLVCITELQKPFDKATFRLNACMIKENGTITQDNEKSNVTVGQLKFTVELMKWTWCADDCPTGLGRYLELDISIKLPAGAKRGVKATTIKEAFRPRRFDLGAGSMVEFSTIVKVDGAFLPLAGETPKLTQTDGENVVTLRFPRFANALVYDPTIDPGNTIWPPTQGAAKSAPALSAVLAISVLILFVNKVSC